jgi:hypothetical protein
MNKTEQVRRILLTRGLTLYRVSQQSAEIFGRSSSSYIPHNLYSDVANAAAAPSIQQLFALSRITNYRLCDWLAVFGFRLDVIPQLQALISRQRTVLLDSSVYDGQAWIPWFVERSHVQPIQCITPLGQLLKSASPTRVGQLLSLNKRRFLYAKVGHEDSLAFPDLAPGSIIRVDARRSEELLSRTKSALDRPIFFVEHALGFACSRLVPLGKGRVMLSSSHIPFGRVELMLEKELLVHGVVDAELRPVSVAQLAPTISPRITPRHHLPTSEPQINLKEMIRRSRIRAGLSFREASKITQWIGQKLADERYFTAASTLSDYETLIAPPRHIQKIITLCILYSIDLWAFLRAGGLSVDHANGEPIPDELVPRQMPSMPSESRRPFEEDMPLPWKSGFLTTFLNQWEEIPLFLRHSLSEICEIENLSSADVFWVGGDQNHLHPWLIDASFVVIDRHMKKPVRSTGRTFWEQPLYLLFARDRGYLCGCFTLREGIIAIHPYPDRPFTPSEFKDGIDAEVIGKVTAILRRIA